MKIKIEYKNIMMTKSCSILPRDILVNTVKAGLRFVFTVTGQVE